MKGCPTCNRTYSDESLSFCLVDGSILSAAFDSDATIKIQTPNLDRLPREIVPTIPSLGLPVNQFNPPTEANISKNRRVRIIAGVILLLVGGIAIYFVFNRLVTKTSKNVVRANDAERNPLSDTSPSALWKLKNTLSGHTKGVFSLAVSPNGETLVSAFDEPSVKLWDPKTGELKPELRAHDTHALVVTFSPDGNTLATSGHHQLGVRNGKELLEPEIKFWETRTGKLKQRFTVPIYIFGLSFSPDGETLAGCGGGLRGSGGEVLLWDARTLKLKRVLRATDTVLSMAYSPDGKLLATGGGDKVVKLWNAQTWRLVRTLTTDTTAVGLAFSPDGRTLAGAGTFRLVVWDVETGELKQTLDGSQQSFRSLVFSIDGLTLATGSFDEQKSGTILLWDVPTWTIKQTLNGHSDAVTSVVFMPDGKTLASGSEDKTVKLWQIGS